MKSKPRFVTLACGVWTLLLLASPSAGKDLSLTSSTLKAGATIPDQHVFNEFGCTGANVSPDLSWSGAPKDTKAFALTVYDPDAPTGSGWWHWVVFNIPATTTALPAGAGSEGGSKLPAGAVQSRTDFGKAAYGGPCPPQGDKPHRYIFKVVALKDTIPLDKDASGAMVGFYVNQLKIAEGTLQTRFGRSK